MSTKNCIVCGLNEKACLHSLKHREDITDARITKVLWFSIGFVVAIGTLLSEIYIF